MRRLERRCLIPERSKVNYGRLSQQEWKRDPRAGTYFMIEPTVCRSDWQSGIADANQVPISYVAYREALAPQIASIDESGAATSPLTNSTDGGGRRWVEFGADRKSAHHYRFAGQLGLFGWLWSIRPPIRCAYFALDDLAPYLATVTNPFSWLMRKIRSGRSGDPS